MENQEQMSSDNDDIDALRKRLISPSVMKAAVSQDGLLLKDLPWNLTTPAICEAAVKQDGRALAYVPYAWRSESLCSHAYDQLGRLLNAYSNKSVEICDEVGKRKRLLDDKVPDRLEEWLAPKRQRLDNALRGYAWTNGSAVIS